MPSYIITGCDGFVAQHYMNLLARGDRQTVVVGIGRRPPDVIPTSVIFEFQPVDLTNAREVNDVIKRCRSTYIIHLSGMSSVARSWTSPGESFSHNVGAAANLFEAVRQYAPDTRILSIGSSEQYGRKRVTDLPLTEESSLVPTSPYAIARCAQEQLAKLYVQSYHMNIVMTRSFNHIGPNQRPNFLIPSLVQAFAKAVSISSKIVRVEAGDLSLVRDFVDVRDVVSAYQAILLNAESGEVFNVCSGKGVRLRSLVDWLAEISGLETTICVKPELLRPMENPEIVGSYDKLERMLGWKPTIGWKDSLREVFEMARSKILL